ncbi:zinc finger protein 112-like isoform X2 [Cimex lectularius]|nr:zinc finger protein 112-like isoform X2 [Cimex lectularius]XP_024083778.1 zinc finger protein 112-like isoform X2 [Cimex lectularius]XP_024083779.1 zinc finger protein 112-like isoform X2 [Cimex lectularius]
MTKLNMFYEFLHQCIQAEKKLDSYADKCHPQEETILKNINHHDVNSCIWVSDQSSKTQEPLNVGLENEGVIVLSKLDSTLNDSSVQDLVVMVELKYKDNLSSNGTSILELSPMKSISNPAEGPSYETLLDLDTIKENNIINYMGDQNHLSIGEKINEQKKESNQPAKDKVLYECTYCERKFNRRTRLNYHLASHTAIRPHKCDQCDKTFAMRWDLNLHQKVHTRTFACELCDKVFITKSKLDRHARVHTGEKPYPCSHCGKSFGEKRNLDNHIRTHTGIRPFVCAICEKTFAIRSHMVEHLNIHKKTPPFRCPVCSKTFKWRTNYKRHLRLHQGYNCK